MEGSLQGKNDPEVGVFMTPPHNDKKGDLPPGMRGQGDPPSLLTPTSPQTWSSQCTSSLGAHQAGLWGPCEGLQVLFEVQSDVSKGTVYCLICFPEVTRSIYMMLF